MLLKNIIEQWHKEGGLTQTEAGGTAFHVDKKNNILYIITELPGWYIGYHGDLIAKYRDILRENGYFYDIKFIELGIEYVVEF